MQAGGFDLYAHMNERPAADAVCPLCRGVGGIERHPELVFVCRLCGGPRVPPVAGLPLSDEVLGALAKVDRLRKKRTVAGAISTLGFGGAAVGAVLALLVGLASITWALVVALIIAVPGLAAALIGRSQRDAAAKEIGANLDGAWASAAADAARAGKVKSADDLRALFGLDDKRAQQIFNLLAVDAEVGGTGVRIGGPSVPVDPRFAALEERFAREQQAEAEAEGEGHGTADRRAQR